MLSPYSGALPKGVNRCGAIWLTLTIQGAIGYFVKLSKYSLKTINYIAGTLSIEQIADIGFTTTTVHIPVNQVLVGGA